MSENGEHGKCAFVRLYHSSGVQASIPMPTDRKMETAEWKNIFDSITSALEAGWLVQAPGFEPGEIKEEVGWVVRSIKENDDNSTTNVVSLYSSNEALKRPFFKKYLNRDSDIKDFEAVSGLRVADLPVYIGKDGIERGAARQTDAYVIPVAKPFPVVLKPNPHYKKEEADAAKLAGKGYFVPTKVFVRWPSLAAKAEGSTDAPPATSAVPKISPQQVTQMEGFVKLAKANLTAMLQNYGIRSISEMNVNQFEDARGKLKARVDEAMAAAAAAPPQDGSPF